MENALIKSLASFAADTKYLRHGIGDDAAVLSFGDGSDRAIVSTTDLIADGTHFRSEDTTPDLIGRKAMAVNLSDIAAMACRPVAAFVSLLLPNTCDAEYSEAIMAGIRKLGDEFECPIAGGDTNVWKGKLAINVLVLGETTTQGPLLRSGAKPGDWLLVTGKLGGSLAGHHLNFTPRIKEALLLQQRYQLHAGMDLSDGLAMDLPRLCMASGLGAEVVLQDLPLSDELRTMTADPDIRRNRALTDGEDFELLLALPPVEADRLLRDQPLVIPITKVGECISGDEILQSLNGQRTPLIAGGYEHGRSSQ